MKCFYTLQRTLSQVNRLRQRRELKHKGAEMTRSITSVANVKKNKQSRADKCLKEQILQNLSTVSPICSFCTKKCQQNSPGERHLLHSHTIMQYLPSSIQVFYNLPLFQMHKYFHVKFSVRLTFLLSSISCSNIALKTGDRAAAREANIKYNQILHF